MSTGDIISIVAVVLATMGAAVGASIAYKQLSLTNSQLGLAYEQLLHTQDLARGQFLLAIDQSLASFERVRREIAKQARVSRPIELRRYMAAIERIGYLFEKGYLEEEAVVHCYGARLKKLINTTKPDCDYVVLILTGSEADRTGWRDFLWLWTRLQGPLKLRDVPREIQSTRPPRSGVDALADTEPE